jgi:hypothetical protein
MYRVRVSTSFRGYPLVRQTPGWRGAWGEYQFFLDEPIDRCDFWVVNDNVNDEEQASCLPGNTVFVSAEPPSLRRYPAGFLAQFALVVTCHRDIRHPNVLFRQQALGWHVGTGGYHARSREGVFLDYDKLAAMTPADLPKTKLLSVISSAKNQTRGHQLRLRFVEKLEAALAGQVDVFGFGIREVADKWEAIAPYKYHVAIENSSIPDYWTEKLADTFLGGALPIYHGAPNIDDYFEPGSLLRVDIARPEAAVAAVRAAVEGEAFEGSGEAIWRARDMALNRYNFFPMLVELFEERRRRDGPVAADSAPRRLRLRPIADFESAKTRAVRSVARYIPKWIKGRLK